MEEMKKFFTVSQIKTTTLPLWIMPYSVYLRISAKHFFDFVLLIPWVDSLQKSCQNTFMCLPKVSQEFFTGFGSCRKCPETFLPVSAVAESISRIFCRFRQLPKVSPKFFTGFGSCRKSPQNFLPVSAVAESLPNFFYRFRHVPKVSQNFFAGFGTCRNVKNMIV
jgi:hypothetical protein